MARVKSPRNFNYRTGRKRLTEEERERVLPVWIRGYRAYSYLNSEEIGWAINEGISPFSWPGTAIITGKQRAVNKWFRILSSDSEELDKAVANAASIWEAAYPDREIDEEFLKSEVRRYITRLAILTAEAEATRFGVSHGMEPDNLFKYEYFLPQRLRMTARSRRRRYQWESE